MLKSDLRRILPILYGSVCDCSAVDWYSVLGFLELNRLAGRFYTVATEKGIEIPTQVIKYLKRTAEYQKCRNERLGTYLRKIVDALEREKIPYAILKGNVLVHADFQATNGIPYKRSVYGLSERTSNDIDLLVSPKDVGKVENVLTACGYTQGYFNEESNTIRPTNRREILGCRMNRGETVPFQHMTDYDCLRHVEIDVNFSLDYLPVGMEEILSNMLCHTKLYTTREGESVRSLETVDFLVHLILHQYKEMRVYSMVLRGKDLELYKLLDIYLMLQEVDQGELYKRVKEYKIEDQTAVVLKAITEIFGEIEMSDPLDDLVQNYNRGAELVVDPTNKNKPYVWAAEETERLLRLPHTGLLVETTGEGL